MLLIQKKETVMCSVPKYSFRTFGLSFWKYYKITQLRFANGILIECFCSCFFFLFKKYVIVFALIAVAAIAAMQGIGTKLNSTFNNVSSQLI